VWLAGGALTLFALARQKFLKPTDNTRLKSRDAPLVSVLVPARNEERRVLRECVRSILAQDYGNFEVVAVNDRSTDSTGPILRALAAQDARLRVVEGREPPDGWLGKPFALQQALEASRGEWVLATDADMIYDPAALRTAVDYASARGGDALTLVPNFEAVTFWERVFVPTWAWGGLVFFHPDLVNRPKFPFAIGVGGFFLMRRAALERVGGFKAIRAEVLDDMRLAEILKASGARMAAEYAPALVSTRMYSSLGELWESSAKNLFAILHFSLVLTAAMLLWIFAAALLPTALAAAGALMMSLTPSDVYWRQLFIPSFLTWLVFVALLALVNRHCGIPAVYALAAPTGWVLSFVTLVGSAYGVLTGRGLVWKGRRFYESGGVRPPRSAR
jgi:chlorobactene glucosyltransferase